MTEESVPNVQKAFPLALAKEGDRVRIVTLRGGAGLVRRLTDLGLNVGAEILVSQHEGGRLVLIRDDMRLGLGAGMSHKIWVTPSEREEVN